MQPTAIAPCPACAQSGYASRVGVFEVLNVTAAVRKLMVKSAEVSEIERHRTTVKPVPSQLER